MGVGGCVGVCSSVCACHCVGTYASVYKIEMYMHRRESIRVGVGRYICISGLTSIMYAYGYNMSRCV